MGQPVPGPRDTSGGEQGARSGAAPSPFVNTAHPRQDVHRLRTHERELLRYRIAEGLVPSDAVGRVLELGGGIGEFARRLRQRGLAVTFTDLSENNIADARSDGFEAVHLDLNYPLPFDNDVFDGVAMLEVIEHVVAAEQLVDETHRVLKPGGFLILSTPNFAFFANRFRVLRGRLPADEGYHYRFFTPRALRDRLSAAGFDVEVATQTMPAFGVNRLSRLVGRPRRAHVQVPAIVAPFAGHSLYVRARKRPASAVPTLSS